MNENQVSNAETMEKVFPRSKVQFLTEVRPIQKTLSISIFYMTTSINQRTRLVCKCSSTRGPSATRGKPKLLDQVANLDHLSIASGELIKWRCVRLVPS